MLKYSDIIVIQPIWSYFLTCYWIQFACCFIFDSVRLDCSYLILVARLCGPYIVSCAVFLYSLFSFPVFPLPICLLPLYYRKISPWEKILNSLFSICHVNFIVLCLFAFDWMLVGFWSLFSPFKFRYASFNVRILNFKCIDWYRYL